MIQRLNTGFRPIPATTPVDEAANIMVRRGECRNFFQAKARVLRERNPGPHRRGDYGRTEINQSDRDARARVESPQHYRYPYRDDTLEDGSDLPYGGR
jgi:hypothetical protein